MPAGIPQVQDYLKALDAQFQKEWIVATKARQKGFDPSDEIQVKPTNDIASRVEGLVGPPGIAKRIREMAKGLSREEGGLAIAREIAEEKAFTPKGYETELQKKELLLEQGIRSGLAFFTEGVVSAPIEGISKIKILENADQTHYVAVYFSGPIRGAGGTGQAFTVLLADYMRRILEIGDYRPIESEVERVVEESNLYAVKTRAGQYVPTEEEIRHIVTNCPISISGDPTEDYDVNVHKSTRNVESDRVRGGMCLVLAEGICLKASKLLKISKKSSLNWDWLEKLIKVSKKSSTQKIEIKPIEKYIDEIVAGRPIFAYPMRPGGFRLRYGRTRFTGIASKGVHPATMAILDDFIAFGTQLKIERPGKGCIATPCETIEGPTVLMQDGEVKRLETVEEAEKARPQVKKILFLGDLLVSFGDFLKANSPLVPSAWCEEWYQQELEQAGVKKSIEEINAMGAEEAFSLAQKHGLSLAPKFTFFWHDLSAAELKKLAEWLCTGKLAYEWFELKGFEAPNAPEKSLLERLCVPHKLAGGQIKIGTGNAASLLRTLGIMRERSLTMQKFNEAYTQGADNMELVSKLSGVLIRKKAGIYIGASMGRPEKSKERRMKPMVHSLFPIGDHGGKTRDIVKAARDVRNKLEGKIEVEAAIAICPICGRKTIGRNCRNCGEKAEFRRQCTKCNRVCAEDEMACRKCSSPTRNYEKQLIDFSQEYEEATKKIGFRPDSVKGVRGLISAQKTPEALEKGILRAKYGLSVFRDGTCRFDATEIPATHFMPSEIGLSVEKVKELGYQKDRKGNEITSDMQVIELGVQDMIVSDYAADYLLKVTKFIDELLVYEYGLPGYYNCKTPQDMVGKLVVSLAPHTSAGILSRIIGITAVRGIIAHPFLHCACRRNADGDELSIMLLMDDLLNFSTHFLPETRGGKMDAALVLTTVLDPNEIDDEAHAMDCTTRYPIEFYEATLRIAAPSEVKIPIVLDRLNTENQYTGIEYTHEASIMGPLQTKYVQIKNMREKVNLELDLMTRITAVDTQNAAERIILSHFFPDLYGNLHKFSRQKFRCVDCNKSFRRVPLQGKCNRCGGKILLTINKGGITKYLEISKELANKYDLPLYLKQRLLLIEEEIKSVFQDEHAKQFSLAEYV